MKVIEVLDYTKWNIVEKSHNFMKLNANSIEFTVPLAPGEVTKLKYKVVYP